MIKACPLQPLTCKTDVKGCKWNATRNSGATAQDNSKKGLFTAILRILCVALFHKWGSPTRTPPYRGNMPYGMECGYNWLSPSVYGLE